VTHNQKAFGPAAAIGRRKIGSRRFCSRQGYQTILMPKASIFESFVASGISSISL
jgi:hypothetical protein